jgi:nucleotide-binding universal stress UspA family protein
MYKRIFTAIDGSGCARLALEEAIRLAQVTNATVTAVCVVEHAARLVDVGEGVLDDDPTSIEASERATAALAEADECFRKANVQGVARAIDAWGEDIASVLSRTADECEAELVVIGTHGRRGWRRMLMGSVAESLVRLTSLPVLLVRFDPEAEPPIGASAAS